MSPQRGGRLPQHVACSARARPSMPFSCFQATNHRAAGTGMLMCLRCTREFAQPPGSNSCTRKGRNPIRPDADDASDDDRMEEPVSRGINVGGVPEPPDQESSPGASPNKPLSPARQKPVLGMS
ncbi:hypothetical protein NDU88_000581 [Pleurodeles waltl]|uniref:Uncharacterized protein n=1 Tax=Pleurodeles waltl TaxID=8319 RepID=A0AAV7SWY4_PLEWA|nr:hypothetical protein NDU88_000581 [Pleurodeles waltl]